MAPDSIPRGQSSGYGAASDCKKAPFTIDHSKPMMFQVGHLGEHYNDWINQPIISKHGPRLYENDLVERLTQASWWMVPLVWLPVVAFAIRMAISAGTPLVALPLYMLLGAAGGSFSEYILHRYVFHFQADGTYWSNTAHYMIHGYHHKHPQDRMRLVMPPLKVFVMTTAVSSIFFFTMPADITWAVYSGMMLMYVCYDLTHYFLHFGLPVKIGFLQFMRRYHMAHHYDSDHNSRFGITMPVWDLAFGTYRCENLAANKDGKGQ